MRAPILLLVCALLAAGCTGRGEGEENATAPDKAEYEGGQGIALAIRNDGSSPFDFTMVLLGAGNREVAKLEGQVPAGETREKWWTVQPTTYSARMSYTWRGTGSSSHGQDDQTVDLRGCEGVTRVEWRLVQAESQVGSAFQGVTCVETTS